MKMDKYEGNYALLKYRNNASFPQPFFSCLSKSKTFVLDEVIYFLKNSLLVTKYVQNNFLN